MKKKQLFKKSSSRLLFLLWRKLGGLSKVAEKLGTHRSNIVNWRRRGHVPLEMVGIVAKAFNVPAYGLNPKYQALFPGKEYAWENTVDMYELTPKEKKWVLLGKYPS